MWKGGEGAGTELRPELEGGKRGATSPSGHRARTQTLLGEREGGIPLQEKF